MLLWCFIGVVSQNRLCNSIGTLFRSSLCYAMVSYPSFVDAVIIGSKKLLYIFNGFGVIHFENEWQNMHWFLLQVNTNPKIYVIHFIENFTCISFWNE
jgi:hypothetical protein